MYDRLNMNKVINLNFNLKVINPEELGFITFTIGTFLLFSAPILASIFLIVSITVGFFRQKSFFLKDKFNLFLIFISFLMVQSCILFPLTQEAINYESSSRLSTNPYIGLFNWIPLFMSFWGFQFFLDSKKKRKICAISLLCGTIPLLFSGYSQYFLNWYGPYEFLNGLIIWFQRNNPEGRLTSVFNNPNYAGCVFSAIWPFFYAAFRNIKGKLSSKIILLIFNLLLIYATLLTASRNSLGALIIAVLIICIPLNKRYLIISTSSFLVIFFLNSFFRGFFKINFFPSFLFEKLEYQNILNDPRIMIWKNSMFYIVKKPLTGWGGNNFSYIWNNTNEEYFGHSHSIPLELSIQYGVVTALAITGMVSLLLFLSFKKLFLAADLKFIKNQDRDNFDRAWFASVSSLIFSNLIDIHYFDLRISILIWILLAGLKNIIYVKT